MLLLCVAFFWGSAYVVAKALLQSGFAPIAVATFRFVLAGALSGVMMLFNKIFDARYRVFVERKDVLVLFLLALTGVTFFFIIQYTGIGLASASIASIMVSLVSPILISLFSVRLLKEHLRRTQILGIGIASMGTIVVVGETTLTLRNDSNFLLGSLLLLITPFLWATYTIVGKRILEKYDAFLIVAYVNMFGALFLIPFSLAENSFQEVFLLNVNEWLAIIYLGFVCSLLGYLIWYHVLKKVNAGVTGSFMFVQPLITGLLATSFLSEELSWPVVAGGILTFVGVYLVSRKWKS